MLEKIDWKLVINFILEKYEEGYSNINYLERNISVEIIGD